MTARRGRGASSGARSALEQLVERIDAAADGVPAPDTIPTGFASVDRALGGGLRRHDLAVIAGDVGSGKSALVLGIALRAAAAGTPTVLLTGEASPDRVLERALALEGRVSIDELRLGRIGDTARAAVGAAALRLRGLPLSIRALEGADFSEIAAALDSVPRPVLLVVDSLQLAGPPWPAVRPDDRVALTARALKALAVTRDVAVLATAQLPRHQAARPDPRPILDDLGASGAVKQQADVVLGIYREEMYRAGQGVEGATELVVLKNRNGPTGFVDLFFYRQWLRFEDMLDPEP